MIIDGKKISEEIYTQLKKEVDDIVNSNRVGMDSHPTLGAILVGNNSASLKYIAQKRKFSKQIGIGFELLQLDADISEDELLQNIENWNQDENISGYIVQLPLPKQIDSIKIIEAIDPAKDVDGFHPVNQGKILIGDTSGLVPCTPSGVMNILEYQGISLGGKQVVVIGKSNIVGKPLVALLMNAGATVISCNSQTPDIKKFTKEADIVICAAGVPGLLTLDHINDQTVVVDVGFTVVDGKIYGDANFESIHDNGNLITPVPGGVGRMTVACLLQNTMKAYKSNLL